MATKSFTVKSLADPQKAWKIPTGTTSDRPASPAQGQIRYNTTTGGPEYYNGSSWTAFGTSGGGFTNPAVVNLDMNEFDIVQTNNLWGGASGTGPRINVGVSNIGFYDGTNALAFIAGGINEFTKPITILEQSSAPTTNVDGPTLYALSSDHSLYYKKANGTIVGPIGAGGGSSEWTSGSSIIYPSGGASTRVLSGTTNETNLPGGAFQAVSTSGALASFTLFSNFGVTPSIYMGRARGSQASPTAVQSGDFLGQFSFSGYNGAAIAGSAGYTATATETWSSTAYGSKLEYFIRRNGTTAAEVNFLLDEAGNVRITSGSTVVGSTGGFVYAPSVAGTPTGTPSKTYSGTTPIIVDTTGVKLWAYIGGTWSNLTGAGGSSEWTDGGAFLYPSDSTTERSLFGATVETSLVTTDSWVNVVNAGDAILGAYSFSTTAAKGGQYSVYKARGTQASPAAIVSGDALGAFSALGYGTSFVAGFKIVPEATATWSGSESGTRTKIRQIKTGTTTLVDYLTLEGNGDVVLTDGSATATSGAGFAYISSSTGPPTVAPTNAGSYSGRSAIHIDTTNGRIYAYYAAAWNNLSGSGGGGPFTDAGAFIYPTTATDRLLLGKSVETSLTTTDVYANLVSDGNTIEGINSFGTGVTPEVYFSRARGTQASPTDLAGTDNLGRITFRGYQSGFASGVTILVQSTGAWTSGDHGATLAINTIKAGSTTSTQRFKIDSVGNVLVGESGLAVSAAGGFSLITRITGVPSGAVADTVFSPIAYDATNNELYGKGSSTWTRINEWHAGSGFIYSATAANRVLIGASAETNLSNNNLEVVGTVGVNRFGASSGPFLNFYHAGGTQSTPTATSTLTTLHRLNVFGFESTSSSYVVGGRITWTSPNGFSSTDYSTDYKIEKVHENTTLETVFKVDENNNIILAAGSLATSATAGFVYIPTTTGTPSGTPTNVTGHVAMQYDTGANKLWIYNGAWKGVTLA